jgi:hypothetical protein
MAEAPKRLTDDQLVAHHLGMQDRAANAAEHIAAAWRRPVRHNKKLKVSRWGMLSAWCWTVRLSFLRVVTSELLAQRELGTR